LKDFVAWHSLNLTGTMFSKSSFSLIKPKSLDRRFRRLVQAHEQLAGEFGSGRNVQVESLRLNFFLVIGIMLNLLALA
jgi:hypothetical protein